jgi:MFS/sugar transport protein
MTQVPAERATLASWRVWAPDITILMLSFVVAPQIKRFTGDPEGLQRSLFITTAIFVGVGMALYLYTVANVKEQVIRDVAAPGLKESVNTLIKNKPLIWLCLGSLAFLTGLTVLGTLAAYYAIYVLNDAQYIAWNAIAQAVGTFAVAAFIPAIVRLVGKRNGYILLGVVGVVGGVILAFAPPSVPLLAVLGFFVVGIGMGGVNTLMWALEADTVEYGEWKTGIPPYRRHDICLVFLHSKDGPGHWWCRRCLRTRDRGVQLSVGQGRHPSDIRDGRGHPALDWWPCHGIHCAVAADHVVLPAHRQGVPPDRRRDRGPPRRT